MKRRYSSAHDRHLVWEALRDKDDASSILMAVMTKLEANAIHWPKNFNRSTREDALAIKADINVWLENHLSDIMRRGSS